MNHLKGKPVMIAKAKDELTKPEAADGKAEAAGGKPEGGGKSK
jgi:hypothetical protein